jgi:predicted negative regulator of RcsB-dependent stress response
VDRLTRKELKTDKFATEIGHTVEFLERHRREATIVGAAIIVLAVVAVGMYFYMGRQHAVRQTVLFEALQLYDATVGEENPFTKSFPTEEEKWAAVQAKFHELTDQHAGSDESLVAHLYLGSIASDQNRMDEAEEHLRVVLESGHEQYASLAALSLAEIYPDLGRRDEAEQLLRNLMENPTVLVSKEQATISLAQLIADSQPEEARQLLEPLRAGRSAVSRSALTVLGQLGDTPTP